MSFSIIKQDITKLNVDAIVSYRYSSDPSLMDKFIIEKSDNNKASFIINAYNLLGEQLKNKDSLFEYYHALLNVAIEAGFKSIAFPPLDKTLNVALMVIKGFLEHHELSIFIVVTEKVKKEINFSYLSDLRDYINENIMLDYSRMNVSSQIMASIAPKKISSIKEQKPKRERLLIDLEKNKGESFVKALFRIIDEKGLNDVYVYKKANIDRKLFSKIKSNYDYQPSKITAISFALALELHLDEAKDLLNKAGFALTNSNEFDLIIEYLIDNEIYDLFEINQVLIYYNQKTIGTYE